jgi:hypothetical protein
VVIARRRRTGRVLAALALLAAAAVGAGESDPVRVDQWDALPLGPLDLSGAWHRYPAGRTPFSRPPAVVLDEGRRVLELQTNGEAMRIGRGVAVDLRHTPWLTWEWKPLVLPEGGDVRDRRRNDQAGRVMLVFEGMRGLLYVWDTTAPVGTETAPEDLDIFQRALVVVRSGPDGLGRWSRERRNVREDYRRLFDEEPGRIKLVGFESHSNDTRSRGAIRFGRLSFEAR